MLKDPPVFDLDSKLNNVFEDILNPEILEVVLWYFAELEIYFPDVFLQKDVSTHLILLSSDSSILICLI